MDKINLSRVFSRYIEGLKINAKLHFRDLEIKFGIPLVLGILICLFFIFSPGDISDIKAVVGNAISAVSIISGLMCALAVLVFQLRVQLSTDDCFKERTREYSLIDHLFNDVLWDVVVGLSCALLLVITSGLIALGSVISALLLAVSSALSIHFLLVTAMCVKRLSIAYEVISKAWSKRR